MLLCFKDLMNVTEEVAIYRPNICTLLPSAFIRGDLNTATRGPFIRSLISCLFSDEVYHLYFNHLCKENYVLPSSLRFRPPLRSAKSAYSFLKLWIDEYHSSRLCLRALFSRSLSELCFDQQLRNFLGWGVLLFERTTDIYQTERETRQKIPPFAQ